MEVRSPDPSANPYLLISLLLAAGFEGIKDTLIPPEEAKGDMLSSPSDERLPASLSSAVEVAEKSAFIRSVIPEKIVSLYLDEKRKDACLCERESLDHMALVRRYLSFV